MSSGDTLWAMPGRYGASAYDGFVASFNNFTIAPTNETAGYTLSHGIQISQGSWSLHSGNAYKATIGSGITILAVQKLWLYVVDSYGRPKSEMTNVASAAACVSTNDSWYYDSAAGIMYCNFAGDNPLTNDLYATYPVEYIPNQGNSLIWITGSGNRVIGARVENIRYTVSGPYGVRLSGTNNLIQACISRNMGWHALSNVATGDISGSIIEDCTLWGQGTTNSASLIVNYGAANMTNVEVRRCTLHNYVPLKVDGTPIATLSGIAGCHHHTDTVAKVQGITYRNVVQRFYEQAGEAFTGVDVDTSRVPSDDSVDETKPDSYPVRYIDCQLNNGYGWGFPLGASLNRCTALMPNRLGTGSPNFQSAGFTLTQKIALFASHIAANLYVAAGQRSIFSANRHNDFNASDGTTGSSTSIIAVNSNFVDIAQEVGDPASAWPRLVTWNSGTIAANTGRMIMLGNVIRGDSRQGITLSVNESATQGASSAFTWTKNWYRYMDPNAALYGTAAYQTKALFAAGKDTAGVYDLDIGIAAPQTSPSVAPGTGVLARKISQTIHVNLGINKQAFSLRIGATQDGSAIALVSSINEAIGGPGVYDDDDE